MNLHSLEGRQFRNFDNFSFIPSSGINLLYGLNGSGKTSLLEAIYFIGTGKSFRVSKANNLIQEGASQFSLFAQLASGRGKILKAGIQRLSNQTLIKVNGDFVRKASTLANLLPIQIIEPNLHQIMDDGPEFRRKFIEWGVFHVEPSYEAVWKQYRRNLAQRNAALKKRLPDKQVKEWDRGMAQAATEIDHMRKSYLERLLSAINKTPDQENILNRCDFEYYQGWPRELSYLECLTMNLHSDKERGFTQSGPHRADIRIKLGKLQAKDILSRGQQKMLISALLVAQCQIIKAELNKDVVLLIDDFVSELDENSQKRFMRLVAATQCQAFVTATHGESLREACGDIPYRMFHVEHGQIRQVV